MANPRQSGQPTRRSRAQGPPFSTKAFSRSDAARSFKDAFRRTDPPPFQPGVRASVTRASAANPRQRGQAARFSPFQQRRFREVTRGGARGSEVLALAGVGRWRMHQTAGRPQMRFRTTLFNQGISRPAAPACNPVHGCSPPSSPELALVLRTCFVERFLHPFQPRRFANPRGLTRACVATRARVATRASVAYPRQRGLPAPARSPTCRALPFQQRRFRPVATQLALASVAGGCRTVRGRSTTCFVERPFSTKVSRPAWPNLLVFHGPPFSTKVLSRARAQPDARLSLLSPFSTKAFRESAWGNSRQRGPPAPAWPTRASVAHPRQRGPPTPAWPTHASVANPRQRGQPAPAWPTRASVAQLRESTLTRQPIVPCWGYTLRTLMGMTSKPWSS